MPTRILTLHSFCLSHFSLQEIQLEVFSERRDGGGGLVKKNLTGSHRCHGIMQKVCCGTCCFLFKTMTVEVLSSLGINAKCVRTNPAVTCKRKQTYKPKKKKTEYGVTSCLHTCMCDVLVIRSEGGGFHYPGSGGVQRLKKYYMYIIYRIHLISMVWNDLD